VIAQPATAPRVTFAVLDAAAAHDRMTPAVRLRLRAESVEHRAVTGLALTLRVQIAAERRRYGAPESERLTELFGVPTQWSRSLGPVTWCEPAVNVGAFDEFAEFAVTLPCSYDFDVSGAKYLAALDDGDIPIDVLPSGMMFFPAADGRLQTARVPWTDDIAARVPVAVWREAVDCAFPDTAWIRIGRPALAALQAYRSRHGFTAWEPMFAALLGNARE
jgi:hypothetical protein